VRAGVLPGRQKDAESDTLRFVKGHKIAMAGDGVNDAHTALAAADVVSRWARVQMLAKNGK